MKSHTKIVLYTTLGMWWIISVNPLYLIFGKPNGFVEGINKNKYLTLVPANERKEKSKKIWRTVD